jgi:hypothetical protein
VKTYPELTFNPQYDELDIHTLFLERIDLDKEINGEEVELVRYSDNNRIQYVRVRGLQLKHWQL